MTPSGRDPLAEVASWVPDQQPATMPRPATVGFDIEAFIAAHDIKVRRVLPWNGGRKLELDVCPFDPEHTGGCAVIMQSADGKLRFKCHHNGCVDKHWRDVRQLLEGDTAQCAANVLDWPDPVPFLARNTPALPADLLPGFLGDMASATARATETPVELAALLGVAVVAASVAKKVVVCPEPGYIEPVNIYVAVGMESGNGACQ